MTAPAGDDYIWLGTVSGAWEDAANWEDSTAGTDPAATPPGALDSVTFFAGALQTITGTGTAAAALFEGEEDFAGTLSLGTVVLSPEYDGSYLLTIVAGGTLAATSFDLTGGLNGPQEVDVTGPGAVLRVSGTLTDSGQFVVTDGGQVQAGALLLNGYDQQVLSVDNRSSVEIGTLGNAAAGALTVDDGATLTDDKTIDFYNFSNVISAPVIDNGTIQADTPLTFASGDLTGTGVVEIAAGQFVSLAAAASGDVRFDLAAQAALILGEADAGVTIDFGGPGGVLNLESYTTQTFVQGYPYDAETVGAQASIIGFSLSDVINLAGAANGATYAAGPASLTGSLILTEDGAPVTTLALDGDYTGDRFVAIPGGAVSQTEIVLLPQAAGSISAGTDTGDQFLWVGPISGDWNDAANWEDLTAQADPAAVAPGTLDSATISDNGQDEQVIGGSGAAATLTLNGDHLITGSFSVGTLDIANTNLMAETTEIADGGTVIAAMAAGSPYGANLTVSGADSLLRVTGSLATGGMGLVAEDGGVIQLASLLENDGGGGLLVDAASSIEIGTLGGAASGAITVDDGATLTAGRGQYDELAFSGSVIDNGLISSNNNLLFNGGTLTGGGTVAVQGDAFVSIATSIGGSLVLQLGSGASANLGLAGSGAEISLTGHNILDLAPVQLLEPEGYYEQVPIAVSAGITGLNGSELILVNDVQVTGVTYAAGPAADTGSLILTNGADVVTTLTLDGNFTGDQFAVLQTSFDQAEILLVPPNNPGTISPGTSLGDDFGWTGPVDGAWNDAANWSDETTYAHPATIAPGELDRVHISGVVSGSGVAASAEFEGAVLTGTFTIGTSTVDGYDTLSVIAGGTLATGTLADDGNIDVIGTGSSLLVTGSLDVSGNDNATFAAVGGAAVRAAALVSDAYDETILTDTQSSIEIGTLGNAAPGALTVDPGATLSVPQSGSPYDNPDLSLYGAVADDGTILSATSLAFAGGTLSGTGLVSIATGGSVSDADTTTGNVQFLLGSGAALAIAGAGGNTGISLGGTGDILTLGQPYYGYDGAPAPSLNMQAVISGFASSDVLYVDAPDDSAGYVPGPVSGTGALLLGSAGTVTGTLALDGNFTGETFAAVQLEPGQLQIIVYSAAGTGLSAGTENGDSFLWTNTFAGAWNDASNWEDASLGDDPATLAPGALDSVTFAGGTAFFQVIGGSGLAADASFGGKNAVTGTLALGTLGLDPYADLVIAGGGEITAGEAIPLEGANIRVAGPGALLSIGSALTLYGFGGDLEAASGGAVQASGLTLSGGEDMVSVDDQSSVELGTLGQAALGALTVDDGATLVAAYDPFGGDNRVNGNVVDNGTIIAGTGLILDGDSACGSGTVLVQDGAYVSAYGSISGNLQFQLGSNAALVVADAAESVGITLQGSYDAVGLGHHSRYDSFYDQGSFAVQSTVIGFNATDAIFVFDTVTSANFAAGPAAGTGTLLMTDGTATLGTLALAGTFADDNFLVVPMYDPYTAEESEIVILPGTISNSNGTVSLDVESGQTFGLDILRNDLALAPSGVISTLILDGTGTATVTDFDASTLDLGGGAALRLDDAYLTYGQITISAGAEMSGFGYLLDTVANAGSIVAAGGTLELAGGLGGAGALVIDGGAALRADTGLAAGQNVSFSGAGGELILDGGSPGSIAGFASGDTIILESLTATAASLVSDSLLEIGGVTLDLAGSFNTGDLALSTDGTNTTIVSDSAPCFCAGTAILTPRGEIPVGRLRIGDAVLTLDGSARPIKWIGRRAYDGRFIAGQHLKLPVCIRRDAIADNVPARDLWVSPGHAIHLDGRLIPAWRLLNGVSITQAERVDRVEYFHIELDRHAVIFAENCPAESFFDDDCRGQFQNAGEFARLYGSVMPGRGLARTESGLALDRLRRRLARRAGLAPRREKQDGPMRGFLDLAGPDRIAGWAQLLAAPETPVRLDICLADRVVARVLANTYRADLREAGLGSGCHGFVWKIPRGLNGGFHIRRSHDGAVLPKAVPAARLAGLR